MVQFFHGIPKICQFSSNTYVLPESAKEVYFFWPSGIFLIINIYLSRTQTTKYQRLRQKYLLLILIRERAKITNWLRLNWNQQLSCLLWQYVLFHEIRYPEHLINQCFVTFDCSFASSTFNLIGATITHTMG